MNRCFLLVFICLSLVVAGHAATPVHSAVSGPWSAATTWEGGHVPGAGEVVQVQPRHRVVYDVSSTAVIRAIHVGGILTFSREKDTLLCVGLIRIAPGTDCTEEGFDCHAPVVKASQGGEGPALEVGTQTNPIPPDRHAVIRLTYVEGMDKQSFPALVCCGGRMDLHGAPLSRSWVKLGESAFPHSQELGLAEPVTGWRAGDHLLLPTTEVGEFYGRDKTGRRVVTSMLEDTQTEEAVIAQTDGTGVLLGQPLKFKHQAEGKYRGEVANLSRNVIVESADPAGVRGHTMYHGHSTGSLSYAEFRHLGKEGVLGRYPIHYHLCGDSMRGSSVVGVSVWDSKNRWITIHGTDYLVVRDCVGFRSTGHGYFFEDGTEVFNVLDHNLAVQALMGKPLPQQVLPFDSNDGAGFWWGNCLNSFTHNAAVECEKHGYRFQMTKTATFDPVLPVRQQDGRTRKADVRTLPFIRFEGNEAHGQRRFGLNLGGFHAQNDTADLDRDGNVIDRIGYLSGDVQGVGPDDNHPFRIKDFLVWRGQWGFHTTAPNVLIDGFTAFDITYVVWRSNIAGHDYNNLDFHDIRTSTFFENWGVGNSRGQQLRYLEPHDTTAPITVVTGLRWLDKTRVRVSGIAADDSKIASVIVNGEAADLHAGALTDWSVTLPARDGRVELLAMATDNAGNQEQTPHRLTANWEESVPAVTLFAAPAASKVETVREARPDPASLKWPLWDGHESVASYAARNHLEPVRSLSLEGEKIELVLVPAGSFVMGSPADETGHEADEGPQHQVVISHPFYLGKTEVTQAQYEKVMGSNPSAFHGSDRPVEQVSWDDAQGFLKKAGRHLRLPTEAEWEFACRAGTATAYSSGSAVADLGRVGWSGYLFQKAHAGEGYETYAVGGKAANALGLHDMHGNVYEWCADWYDSAYYTSSPWLNPAGPGSGDQRVIRGGSWEATAAHARSANRNGFAADHHGYVIGFRVVQPVDAAP